MDFLSKDATDLINALAFFSPEERSEFFRWSQTTSEFESVTKRMLFGHPYYIFRIGDEAVFLDGALEHVPPNHRTTIEKYRSKNLMPTRDYVDEILFLKLEDAPNRRGSIILALPIEGIHSFCQSREGAEKLTSAELKSLGQLLAGFEPQEAAKLDDVSYETKRTHIKSINSKLGFSRQIDLVAELIAGLLLEIVASSEVSKDTSSFEKYFTRYAPRKTRLHRIVGKSGKTHRIIDIGPAQGRPIVSIHTTLIGTVDDSFSDVLEDHNIRIIWPVRHGALNEDDPLLPFEEHVEAALDGIYAAIQFTGADAAPIHTIGSSAYLAIKFAKRYPDMVTSLILQGTGTLQTNRMFANQKILRSICKLATKNPLTLNLVFKFLDAKLNNPEAALSFFSKTYKSSPKDLVHIEAEFGPPDFGERLRMFIQSSLHSIVHDFRFAGEKYWQTATEIDTPLYFIHGTDDGVCPISEIPKLIEDIGRGELLPIEGCGNMTSYEHLPQTMKIISCLL